MKGKIVTIIGIFVVILAAFAYIMFESHVKTSSNVTAVNVVVAKQDISCDTVVKDIEQAKQLFTVRRVSIDDVVSGAVTVSSTEDVDSSLFTKLKSYFVKSEPDYNQLSQFVGLKLTREYAKNEQVLSDFVSTDITEFKENERIYTPDGLIVNSAIATELHKGDYVDLWILTQNEVTEEVTATSFYGPLKIYKIKDADSNELTGDATSATISLVFKLSNDDIANISARLQENDCIGCFVVKYGAKPTQEQLKATFLNKETEKETTTTIETSEETQEDVVVEETNVDETVVEENTNEEVTTEIEETNEIEETSETTTEETVADAA